VVGRALAAAILCALAGASTAAAAVPVKRPPLTWMRGDGSYTKASRGTHSITTIVIHDTDGGTLDGNIWWLSGGHSHASAHYVVARDGSIVQLVHLSDIAWHSGNAFVNAHSIGIEHVGNTYDAAGYTNAEYRSSARLVAWLVRRYSIPVDRTHIIGHSQVPDPNDPFLFGGSDHHTDPGPHWRWGYYLNLVRHFAFPDRYAVRVDTTTIDRGETLTGIVPWAVSTKRARRVEFLLDGHVVWSDSRKPFAFAAGHGWNTTQVANGRHVLTVRAIGAGHSASQQLVVNVANRNFALTTSAIHAWEKVKGVLRVRANVRGAHTGGIGLYIDGHIVSRDRRAPYTLHWDSRRARNGLHRITLAAIARDGRVATRRLPLVVSNVTRPKRAPLPPPTQNLAEGQVVDGPVDWRAHTVGPVARLDFVVDGVTVATQTREPWSTTWTPTPGAHTLEVRAATRDGRRSTAAVDVTSSS
jgi:N-acetyl-anhydromuramyl-L-alanine amidase AmpD